MYYLASFFTVKQLLYLKRIEVVFVTWFRGFCYMWMI